MSGLFGTDGVRGTVGQAPMTPDVILRLANAAGRVIKAQFDAQNTEGKPCVVVGKDTRISGYMIESLIEAGFTSAGVDVLLCGPIPTPAVAYLTRALRLAAGVVISASHNPYPDNGIKFFGAGGLKLSDAIQAEFEAAYAQGIICLSSEKLGKAKRITDAAGRYLEFCKNTVEADFSLKGLKLVVDSAHGAAYQIAAPLLRELGAEVIAIGNAPNGLNINDGVGATHPESLIAAVKTEGADYGVALDGDADRLLMVDKSGRLFDGDELLYAIVKHRALSETVQGVCGTLMTNLALETALQKQGIAFYRAKVGDRYVLEALQEKGWLYGGENSGHILCLDKHSTGDGLISCLQVLRAVVLAKQSLAELIGDLSLYPQTMLNLKLGNANAKTLMQTEQTLNAVKEAEASLGSAGRLLLRPSGTEPLIRVMVEAKDKTLAQSTAQRVYDAIAAQLTAS